MESARVLGTGARDCGTPIGPRAIAPLPALPTRFAPDLFALVLFALVLFALARFALASTSAMAADDFSISLDALWDFDHPATAETRFVAEAARHPAASREALEARTQVARAQGLQRKFGDADATLDTVRDGLADAPERVRVRYLLERGRRLNSSGSTKEALAWFQQALAASAKDTLPGAAYYRIDALHMLAIASPPGEQLDWNQKALAAAEGADDPRSRGWRASLLHNLGWTMHDLGDYSQALAYWREALALREAAHDASRIRIAQWTVARGLRSLRQIDEAEAIQRKLAAEFDALGEPDGYVFEELAEIALARGDRAATQRWATKAYAILNADPELRATDAARLARLAGLAQPQPGATR